MHGRIGATTTSTPRTRRQTMGAQPLRVALLGCGVVGQPGGTSAETPGGDLAARVGAPFELVGIGVRRPRRRPAGARQAARDHGHRRARGPSATSTSSIELMGGIEPARTALLERDEPRRVSVVTANKALLADDGADAPRAGRRGAASTSTTRPASPAPSRCCDRCASPSPATTCSRVLGIVNGTTNFILTKMDETGASFDEALAEAQALGYAEADPTADVDGHRRRRQGGDPRRPRLPHPGDPRRRALRGHHRR